MTRSQSISYYILLIKPKIIQSQTKINGGRKPSFLYKELHPFRSKISNLLL